MTYHPPASGPFYDADGRSLWAGARCEHYATPVVVRWMGVLFCPHCDRWMR